MAFQNPLGPGTSSPPQSTVPCCTNSAWVVLVPGRNPTSSKPPTTYVLLESRRGFAVNLSDTVHIPVDDGNFAGNCSADAALSQSDDFITARMFANVFSGLRYDAATCTTPVGDAGMP